MNNNILELMTTANKIVIYKDGIKNEIQANTTTSNSILQEVSHLSQNCRECPAFGVSLHNETIDAMQSGIWIEFIFDKTNYHNEMPFESLLIQVLGEYTGFNIIRKYENKYDGRCFYVDLLDSNLSSLEIILNSI